MIIELDYLLITLLKKMKKYFLFLNLFFFTASPGGFAQGVDSSIQPLLLQNEMWWGGTVQYGSA